jgi:hypothetical protein
MMFPLEDWHFDVAWNRTRLGFHEWVAMMAEATQDEPFFHHEPMNAHIFKWAKEVMRDQTLLGYAEWAEEKRNAGQRIARLASRVRGNVSSARGLAATS